MKGVFKGNDCRPLGIVPGNLDCVFNGFGTAIGEHGRLGKIPGSEGTEPLCQFHIRLVHDDVKTGVCVLLRLLLYCRYHLLATMTHVSHPNSASEVNVLLAFDILDGGTLGLFHKYRGYVKKALVEHVLLSEPSIPGRFFAPLSISFSTSII